MEVCRFTFSITSVVRDETSSSRVSQRRAVELGFLLLTTTFYVLALIDFAQDESEIWSLYQKRLDIFM